MKPSKRQRAFRPSNAEWQRLHRDYPTMGAVRAAECRFSIAHAARDWADGEMRTQKEGATHANQPRPD